MAQFPVSTSSEQSIHAALELSKNSWLLAIQVPGRDNPSLYPIKGGNAEGLMAKLDEDDHFSQLLAVGAELVGAVTVEALPEERGPQETTPGALP